MAKIKSSIVTTGTIGFAVSWVMSGGSHVSLGGKDVDLPPGTYLLQWELRGDVGATGEFKVAATDSNTGKPCTTGVQTVPAGLVQIGSGSDHLPSYQPVFFNVV